MTSITVMLNRPIILIQPRLKKVLFPTPNPPIGIGYLASYLEKNGFKTYIVDMNIHNTTTATLLDFIGHKEPLLVGISSNTPNYPNMIDLSRTIKERFRALPIVLGGVHPSFLAEQSLDETGADFVVIGEGELTLLDLAEALSKGITDLSSIPGLAFKQAGTVVRTPARALIENLDEIPFPAWDKIPPNKYPREPHSTIMKYNRYAPVFSTRGCPFDCSYCASCRFWKQRIRFRSPSNVVDEIQYLHEHFGIKEIHFWDDNLTLKKAHVVGICKEIIRRGLNKLAYSAPNGIRADIIDEKTLKIMKMAGFYSLTFAIESGCQEILRLNGKRFSLQKALDNARIAKKLGYHLSSFYIIGFPEDTKETIQKTIDFARIFPCGSKKFFIMNPLPGSKIFERYTTMHDIRKIDWNHMHFLTGALNVSTTFSIKEIESFLHKAFRQVILQFPAVLHTIFIRFIKFGHLSQFLSNLEKIKQLIF